MICTRNRALQTSTVLLTTI